MVNLLLRTDMPRPFRVPIDSSSGINSNHFYVENIFEELDSPGEWWYNRSSSQLFLMPNGTLGSDTVIAVPVLETLVAINGTAGNPAQVSALWQCLGEM
jgi:hypothetical protein